MSFVVLKKQQDKMVNHNVLSPAQALECAQQYVGQSVLVRGFLVVFSGRVVSEKPLVLHFEAAILQLDFPSIEMYRMVDDLDFVPSAFLLIHSLTFGADVLESHLPGRLACAIGSEYIFMSPVTVRATLQKSSSADPAVDYELFNPEEVIIESPEHHGKTITFAPQ